MGTNQEKKKEERWKGMICFLVYCLFHSPTSTWNPRWNEEGERRNETIRIKEIGDEKERKTSSRRIRLCKCHRSTFVRAAEKTEQADFGWTKACSVPIRNTVPYCARLLQVAKLIESVGATLQQKSYRRHRSGEATFVLRIPLLPLRYHLSISSTRVRRDHVACRPQHVR